jgi:diguanylate cyclase (GGDEF)-like protein
MVDLQESSRIRQHLIGLLDEDLHNQNRLLVELSHISAETGIHAHAALLMALTHLPFEESEARSHWEAILKHHQDLRQQTGRPVGVRLAVFDYFMNVNRKLVNPKIIELAIFEEAEKSASSDWMTGLYNRHFFRGNLLTELRRCKRFGLVFSLLYIDVDNFRDLNDRFGRVVTDIFLKEIAVLLKNKVRDIDIAARWSGEEFLVALPETERMGAYVVGERIRAGIEQHFRQREHAGKPVRLSVSVGISEYPSDAGVGEQLIQTSAEALYQAKARGKNRVSVYFREKRDYIRFDARRRQLQVQVQSPAEPASGARRARNVSRSGMLFDSETAYPLGQQLALECTNLNGDERLALRARVVRVEEIESEGARTLYEIGVAFVFQWEHEEAQLNEFLKREKLDTPVPTPQHDLS